MTSWLENEIKKLDSKGFGPDDPRTSSLNGDPKDFSSLSFENQRKILEAELRLRQYIDFVKGIDSKT